MRQRSQLGRVLELPSHPPVTGVLRWEIRESALGSALEGAPRNRGAPESAPECSRRLGVLLRVLNVGC